MKIKNKLTQKLNRVVALSSIPAREIITKYNKRKLFINNILGVDFK